MINKLYLNSHIIDEAAKNWRKFKLKRIMLQEFLSMEDYNNLSHILGNLKRKHMRIADRFSYTELVNVSEIKRIFCGKEFKRFLGRITGKRVGKVNLSVKEYGWKDYSLVHDSEYGKSGIEFFFFCLRKGLKWDDFWGGNKIYEATSEALIFTPIANSFCMIDKKKDVKEFIQYVNNYAGDEKIFVVEGTIN